jgi:hypothetical protein
MGEPSVTLRLRSRGNLDLRFPRSSGKESRAETSTTGPCVTVRWPAWVTCCGHAAGAFSVGLIRYRARSLWEAWLWGSCAVYPSPCAPCWRRHGELEDEDERNGLSQAVEKNPTKSHLPSCGAEPPLLRSSNPNQTPPEVTQLAHPSSNECGCVSLPKHRRLQRLQRKHPIWPHPAVILLTHTNPLPQISSISSVAHQDMWLLPQILPTPSLPSFP